MIAPQESSLLGLVSVIAPVVVTGNTVVVVSSYARPLPAVTFAEVLATSDVPGGVINILTGDHTTVFPWLASHMDVNAIDLVGAAGDPATTTEYEVAAAENLKRVRRAPAVEPDWTEPTGPRHDDRLPGDQDRLAPDRSLTGPRGGFRPVRTSANARTVLSWRLVRLGDPASAGPGPNQRTPRSRSDGRAGGAAACRVARRGRDRPGTSRR